MPLRIEWLHILYNKVWTYHAFELTFFLICTNSPYVVVYCGKPASNLSWLQCYTKKKQQKKLGKIDNILTVTKAPAKKY